MSKLKTVLVLSLILLFFTFILLSINLIFKGLKASASINETETSKTLSEQVLWNTVNNWRSSQGLATYAKSEILCDFATQRLGEIKTEYSHAGMSRHLEEWFRQSGYAELSENLSFVSRDENETLQGWLNSPSHRAALMSNYKYSCIKADGFSAVQLFAK